MVIEKAYLVTLKGELVNAYYRAGYTDEDIVKFWNEEIAKQIAEAVHIRLQVPSALKVEARPVKRGKWINAGDFEERSECHATRLKEFQSYYGKVTRWEKSNYCPYCGARMMKDGDTSG